MDYSKMIFTAIQNGEVVNLLRGDTGYAIPVSQFSADVLPTEIDVILIQCFYKQMGLIEGIDFIFKDALDKLLIGCASDVYIALLYFNACVFQEEIRKASFLIEKEAFAKKLKQEIKSHESELRNQVGFANGSVKLNPWIYIEKWNEKYEKKYGFSIL